MELHQDLWRQETESLHDVVCVILFYSTVPDVTDGQSDGRIQGHSMHIPRLHSVAR